MTHRQSDQHDGSACTSGAPDREIQWWRTDDLWEYALYTGQGGLYSQCQGSTS